MTPSEHIERHKILHRHLDELLADFIIENPDRSGYLDATIHEFLKWSHLQTTNPSDREGRYKEEV